MTGNLRFLLKGLLFSAVWSSASVSAKFGLRSAQPLVLYQLRFLLAAILLLILISLLPGNRLPKGKEWRQLALFGFLNVSLALGLFALAIKEVAAGVGALQVGLNPLVISILSSFIVGRKVKWNEWLALLLGIMGVFLAVYPLLGQSYVTLKGLLLLGCSTLAYSSAAVYFSTVNWKLTKLSINAWQGAFGAIFLLPATMIFFEDVNQFDLRFFLSAFWLGVPISVGAVFLWITLISVDTVKASMFLFLCPVFGFFYAWAFLNEPFSLYTVAALIAVMASLWLGQKKETSPN